MKRLFCPVLLWPMQHLWEGSPELSAKKIGARLGVTKNVVIGHANRRGWKARPSPLQLSRPARTTMLERLDALDVFPPTGRCVYPIGHPKNDGFRFCGDRVAQVGAPYCADHSRTCWTAHARKVAAGKQRGLI